MLRIYSYHVDCRRMGDLEGLFVVDEHGEACLRALIESKRDVNYGEVLGKHSEIIVSVDDDELTPVDATQDEIATVLRVFGRSGCGTVAVLSGFCPLSCFDADGLTADELLAWAKGADPNVDEEEA
jgi:hypothetical protein